MPILTTNIQEILEDLTSVLSERTTKRYSLAQRKRAIDRAYEKILTNEDFNFMETSSSLLTVTAGSTSFALPDDFFKISLSYQALYRNSKAPENMMSYLAKPNRLRADWSVSDEPEYWWNIGKTGYLLNKSDSNYSLFLEYTKVPEKISDGGTILIPAGRADIIAWWGALELLSPTNPKRPEVVRYSQELFSELVKRYSVDQAENEQEFIVDTNGF